MEFGSGSEKSTECESGLHSFKWPVGGLAMLLQEQVRLVSIKWENDPTDHLTGDLRKHFVDEFMVSVAGFEHLQLVNMVLITSNKDEKGGYTLGQTIKW